LVPLKLVERWKPAKHLTAVEILALERDPTAFHRRKMYWSKIANLAQGQYEGHERLKIEVLADWIGVESCEY
jgi:hypothetical protein